MSQLLRPVVLLIEDSEDDFFFFRRSLNKTGVPCALFRVSDGGGAVQYLEAAVTTDSERPRPDLIFLDLKLPMLSGFEVLTWIRQQASNADYNVAVLSGSEDESDIARATALGVSGYLVKPIATEELKSRLLQWQAEHAESSVAAQRPPLAL